MGMALEIVDSFATNPGTTTPAATTAFPGDVFAVRNFNSPSQAHLCAAWGAAATPGLFRIRSPRLHDNVQGIRLRHDVASTPRDKLGLYGSQQLYAQDTLIVETTGGAAETDGVGYLVYYDDLPGAAARLHSVEDVAARGVNILTVEVAVGSGAAVGARATAVAFNVTEDLLIANTDYAVLGYETDATGLSIGLRGPDTGNLRLGGPATVETVETRDWFARLSKKLGKPCIPVINSANKSGTLVDDSQVVAGVAMNVTWILVELAP